MYFKRLELVGFKSFMDKTTLNFEPGVTAIVGPNGCGKSNIFDSIRWVLGEQSVKSLRGSQMEDVIFNGTDTKQPLGMAEVSLTFDNREKQFAVEHDEVMITRRIFRSGESEYLINKSTVRLKDIQELLLGTGIGAESYSIIAQGKIDLILSSRPEDRRMVFDEASGITKYKAQKREALRRLEETEQNLLRLNDIITEVKRSIGYLERQANKARRYQSSFEELKKKEVMLSILQRASVCREMEKLAGELACLKQQEDRMLGDLQEQESSIAKRSEEQRLLEESINEIKSIVVQMENLIQRNTQHIHFNHERIKELDSTRAYLDTQVVQARQRLVQDEEKFSSLQSEHEQLRRALGDKTLALNENEQQLSGLVSAIKLAQDSIAEAKKHILGLATKAAAAKNELTEAHSKQQVFLARQKRLQLEKAKINEEKSSVESNLKVLTVELSQVEEAYNQIYAQLQEAKATLESQTQALAAITQRIDALEKQKSSLESQKAFLERLKSQYEDISESMNATIYLDKQPLERITGLVVKINDAAGLQFPAAGGPQPSYSCAGEAKPIDLDATKVIEKLAEVEAQLAALRQEKSAAEHTLAALAVSVETLTQKQQDQAVAVANKKTVQQGVLEQFEKLKSEEEVILLELSDVQESMIALEAKLSYITTYIANLENEHKATESSIHTSQEQSNLNAKIKEEVLVVIAQGKTEIENLKKQLESEDQQFRALEEEVAKGRQHIQTLEARITETLQRQQALSVEITGLEADIVKTNEGIAVQKDALSENESAYQGLTSGLSGVNESIEGKRKEIQGLKDQAYQIQMAQKDLEYRAQSMKERLGTSYKIDLDTLVVVGPGQASETQPESAQSPQEPAVTCESVVPDAPVENAAPAVQQPVFVMPAEAVDESLLCAEIEQLKDKVDSYGTVNLVAIEEYDELKKRYDFLNQQQADLVNAKDSLQEAIRKINHTTRKMFVETFEKVQAEFRGYFKLLFNGGDAQLYLIDEQDPLESGIEIVCRPPGKKLQNVLLLSGGEKSLSAIALIFAIFKVKPAPFCILDEIDAALDESNVERFGKLFHEFTSASQFIVITHNKRTIANADVMYGITMQESGVSRIVSVKFASDKPKAPEAKEPEPVAA